MDFLQREVVLMQHFAPPTSKVNFGPKSNVIKVNSSYPTKPNESTVRDDCVNYRECENKLETSKSSLRLYFKRR